MKRKKANKRKINIKSTSLTTLGKQFGSEFSKIIVSSYKTTRRPVVKVNKKKRSR